MSTQVTEAHLELAKTALFSRDKAGRLLTAPMAAQLIADSEAKACAELLQQVANLKYSNHYHRKTAETSRATETDRNNLRADLDAIKSILNEEKARAERAEAELDGIRALADRRNKRYHAEDTTPQLVAALDQALDIAQAELAQFRELAIERARLDWLEENANDIMKYNCRSYIWFAHQNIRAAIDAAMKEDAK